MGQGTRKFFGLYSEVVIMNETPTVQTMTATMFTKPACVTYLPLEHYFVAGYNVQHKFLRLDECIVTVP